MQGQDEEDQRALNNTINWEIIDKYFKENPYNLVAHHLDSFNNFYSDGIFKIFRENNPVKVAEKMDANAKEEERGESLFYMGGKEGNRIYFGKPVIYDTNKSIGENLSDTLEWCKFTGMAWAGDGFYYSRYEKPNGSALSKANEYHRTYYHKLNTPQMSTQ